MFLLKRYDDNNWKKEMKLSLDINNMMAEMIGVEQGITSMDISDLESSISQAKVAMVEKRKRGMMD